MSGFRDRCPACSRRLVITRFDTTFRLPDKSSGSASVSRVACVRTATSCTSIPELIDLLDLCEGRCVFAIESDLVLQEQAWSSAD